MIAFVRRRICVLFKRSPAAYASVALFAATVIAYTIFADRSGDSPRRGQSDDDVGMQDARVAAKLVADLSEAVDSDDADTVSRVLSRATAELGERAASLMELSSSRVGRVDFHGLVVDQNEAPVGGAKVVVDYLGFGVISAKGLRQVTTDSDGRFTLGGRAAEVAITAVEHPDTTRMLSVGDNPMTSGVSDAYYFPVQHFDEPSHLGSSALAPFVIRVWRVDQFPEVVVVGARGSAHVAIELGESGTERHHLLFECERDGRMRSISDLKPWTVRISPIDGGGFQAATDGFLNRAPEDGYDKAFIEVSSDPELLRRTRRAEPPSRYYYRSKNGAVHGVFSIWSFSGYQGPKQCSVLVNYLKYNETGSRELAVRPSRESWGL